MYKPSILAIAVATRVALPAVAGDVEAGRQEASTWVACYGDKGFGGSFYVYQLASRNADELVIKINNYRSGKLFHPVMNLFTVGSPKGVVDISAYYQVLQKPVFISPILMIVGDEDEVAAAA